MKECPQCGEGYVEGSKICPHCGHENGQPYLEPIKPEEDKTFYLEPIDREKGGDKNGI